MLQHQGDGAARGGHKPADSLGGEVSCGFLRGRFLVKEKEI